MTAFFRELESHGPRWAGGAGPEAAIVLSTRARLARNLRSFPFPHRATEVERGTVLGDLRRRLGRIPELAEGVFLELGDLEPVQRKLLRENGLISSGMAREPQERAAALNEGAGRAALVNAADHLHLVAFRPGLDPEGALRDVLDLDLRVEREIDPAFDAELGYLTASPASAGTGLRLSAHLHLAGLMLAGEIEKVCNALSQLRYRVEGLYQQGRTVRGCIFRISNLVTLGLSEHELASDFAFHIGRLVQHEHTAREQLLLRDRTGVEDMAHRDLAVLREARLITSQEAVDRLSHVRLGADTGVLEGLDTQRLNEALRRMQPAHLETARGEALDQRGQSEARAAFLRSLLDPASR